MKLLITGGNSFLGKHVLKRFDEKHISYVASRSTELNLLDFGKLYKYLSENQPTTVLHMAAITGGILGNSNNPAQYLYDNTQMALNIFEVSRFCGIKNIYSLGTVCAYGNLCPIPFKEENIWEGGAPEITNRPYSQAKRTLMMLGETYRQQYGFTGAHLIPINLYGEYDKFDLINSHVIGALINKMVNAQEKGIKIVECFGTGTASREFLYAGDCADAIVKAVMMELDSEVPINLGIGKDILIKDLAYLLKELIGYEGDIVFTGAVSDGQPKRRLDVSRAKALLNWEATTDLRAGLIRTIDFYRATKK